MADYKEKIAYIAIIVLVILTILEIVFGNTMTATLIFITSLLLSFLIKPKEPAAGLYKILFFTLVQIAVSFWLATILNDEALLILGIWNLITMLSLIVYCALILWVALIYSKNKKFVIQLALPILILSIALLIIIYFTKIEIGLFPEVI